MTRRLTVRSPDFDLGPDLPRYWVGGDPFRTHFMNALSSVFPDGEAFFVRAVQHYRGQLAESGEHAELVAQIRAFAGQEAQHAHAHHDHVALLTEQGYLRIAPVNALLDRVLRFANRRFPVYSLACTAALEHLTALMARQLMTRPEAWTADMDPRMAPLWQWHALEEAEHKAVAFDVLAVVSGSHPRRVFSQIEMTLGMVVEIWGRIAYLLYVDGLLFRPRLWTRGLRWLVGRGGLLRGTGSDYRAWFRRDFHPDDVDDGPRIEAWRSRVDAWAA